MTRHGLCVRSGMTPSSRAGVSIVSGYSMGADEKEWDEFEEEFG